MNTDTIVRWVHMLVQFGTDAPDLLSVALGTLGAWCLGLLVEAYFIPASLARRQQQGVTILVTLAASVILGDAIWASIDPVDPARLRLAACFIGGCVAPFLYPIVGRISARFPVVGPLIGSVWTVPEIKP